MGLILRWLGERDKEMNLTTSAEQISHAEWDGRSQRGGGDERDDDSGELHFDFWFFGFWFLIKRK